MPSSYSYSSSWPSIEDHLDDIPREQTFEQVPSFGKALFWNAMFLAGILKGAFILIRLICRL